MGVMVVYRPASEHTRSVVNFLHDFEQRTHRKLEEVDPDSRRGVEICDIYDIVEYPTVVATAGDGRLLNAWRGLPLPLIDEVSYYVE